MIHVANVQDQPCDIELMVPGTYAKLPVQRRRTSGTEDGVQLPVATFTAGRLKDTLPARGMATYRIGFPKEPAE